MNTFKRVALILIVMIGLLYPFVVYWGIQHFEPKFIGLAVASLYFLRLLFVAKKPAMKYLSGLGLVVFCLAIWLLNHPYMLLTLPAIVSLGGLFVFTYSLIEPPTIPAQFALRQGDILCADRLRYTNNLTKIWMAYFVLNTLAALYTAFYCSREIWALYNGFISYLLMGSLFIGEFLYRQFIFERQLQHE